MQRTLSSNMWRVAGWLVACACAGYSLGCVRDIMVGMRPAAEDAGNLDGGGGGTSEDAGTPLTCGLEDCEVSVLSTPVCEGYEELACLAEANACVWKCLVRPLVAGETPCADAVCSVDEVCDAPAGTCDTNAPDLRCVARPNACTKEVSPVCGCDGVTYSNGCEAQRAGALTALSGPCPAPAITPCSTACDPPTPVEITVPACPLGIPNTLVCAELGNGSCAWVARKCEPKPICAQPDPIATSGECWTSADCAFAQTCMSARVCPCDAECAEPNVPGLCR